MSTATQEFIIIDFGVAWTKAFYLVYTKDGSYPSLVIKDRLVLPTSVPDLEISYKEIKTKFVEYKKAKVILTSSFCKKEALQSFSSDVFIENEDVYKTLYAFFGRSHYDVQFIEGGGSNWLQNFEPLKVAAFTSKRTTEIEIENYLGNKRRFIFSVPTEDGDLDIEQAYLKNYILTRGLAQGDKNTLVIATGGILSFSRNRKLILEILVDRINLPFCQILLDTAGVLPAFGALLTFDHEKKEVLQVPSLISLAALVNLGGPAHLKIDFGIDQPQTVAVRLDDLAVYPAEVNKEVKILGINREQLQTSLTVGEMGLILDGRVKPLDLMPKSDLSKEKLHKWREDLSVKEVV